MILEAVIVCVNYSDFLAHTLPHNKEMFNKLVVVTDTKDKQTAWLCEHYNVQCVQTDAFYENGNRFNKAKGINEGLKQLSMNGWVLHLDADIYLPPLTKSILDKLPLDKASLYSADRLMCPSYDEWMKFYNSPAKIHEGWVYVHTTAFPMGVRIAKYHSDGYHPIGYFQLWNPSFSGVWSYPDMHDGADRTDMLFAQNWNRSQRGLIPELLVIHLESEETEVGNMGKNWNGRKTPLFQHTCPIVEQPIPITTKNTKGYRDCWFKRKFNDIYYKLLKLKLHF